MNVDGEEKHRAAGGVKVAQQPAIIHVAHDVLDGIEGAARSRRIVHHQHDAGDDLHHQHEAQDAAEGPPVIQIARHRIDDEGIVHEGEHRQAALEPFQDRIFRLKSAVPSHDAPRLQPIRIMVSEANS